ncbi:rRNA adenine N-6-methyltransferase family protein [Candidatus Vidania fulgoroideorum]
MLKNRDTVFLKNRDKILEIVKNIKLTRKNIEIGPGRGNITKEIVRYIKDSRLILIEINRSFSKLLRRRFLAKGVIIINRNILKVDISKIGKVTIIGNIPYSVYNKILKKLLIDREYIKAQYLMIQVDVLKKIANSRNYNYYLYNTIYTISSICNLKGDDFKPKVRINSVFINMRRRKMLNKSTEEFIISNNKELFRDIYKVKKKQLKASKNSKIEIREYIFILLIFRRKIEGTCKYHK